jgi:hypothetical protein
MLLTREQGRLIELGLRFLKGLAAADLNKSEQRSAAALAEHFRYWRQR